MKGFSPGSSEQEGGIIYSYLQGPLWPLWSTQHTWMEGQGRRPLQEVSGLQEHPGLVIPRRTHCTVILTAVLY